MDGVAASDAGKGSLEMTGAPGVASTTVVEVLEKLDVEFSAVAAAVENGEFALWVGSGISRRAPNLGGLIEKAVEFLRSKAMDPITAREFMPAFNEALMWAEADLGAVTTHFASPFLAWPDRVRESIVKRLWNKYSLLLDVRIEGKDSDYLLWDGVDIRAAFAHPPPPAAEHLCIAILILEGALKQVASANWDGFIEAAVAQLGPGMAGNLQVVVDPDSLRDGAAKAQLLKFHGCIVHAIEDPACYRKYLTASETQITSWAETPLFTPMVNRIVGIATDNKALMVGLSLQDANLQSVFARARRENAWPWPCAPAAQGHVFCEANGLGPKQEAMLKTVYGVNYNNHIRDVQASALLQSWPEQVLLALALRVMTDKLGALLAKRLAPTRLAAATADFVKLLGKMRDAIGGAVAADHTDFVNAAIASWSRLVSLFRDGAVPEYPHCHEVISGNPVAHVANDRNAVSAGFGDLAAALGLLQHGCDVGIWSLSVPTGKLITDGAILARGTYPGAGTRTVFIVRSGREAVELKKIGAFANDNVVVIHADDLWQLMELGSDTLNTGSPRRRGRAPGRTGRTETLHVSLKQMIESETDLPGLQKQFISAVTL